MGKHFAVEMDVKTGYNGKWNFSIIKQIILFLLIFDFLLSIE
jgi:hypothetical protein